ncbi:hypothetical protein PEBR_31949 [Penicillium brasilianum]|uniref:Uncharacterized protein n=1 Tax=Penicillium brasilianum TaxID=104259 RepID=A0A1S9RF97_PENBI|nr:hypothetical protein PEBR_31949 [Penicillium brasilianum]
MNRYRNAPGLRSGPSKASPTTLCQKCLKRDIYECKATAQERPYTARPSRTQQLLNPRLMPKLSEDVPTDLERTTGVADEILAKREAERGRKRDHDTDDPEDRYGQSSKRARSLSTDSADSISTISTNRSTSASPERRSRDGSHANGRRSSVSPPTGETRKRRYSDASDGSSAKSYSSGDRQRSKSRSREWTDDRNIRRRRRESSPEERGRNRDSKKHDSRNTDRRSQSVDKSRIAKERRSMTPDATYDHSEKRTYRDREPLQGQPQGGRSRQDPRSRGGPPRERSMSPYSKRLALTQSMNLGR